VTPRACNIRIGRCRLYPPGETGGALRGNVASERRFFRSILLRAACPPARHSGGPLVHNSYYYLSGHGMIFIEECWGALSFPPECAHRRRL
jgi:hypothetical protein